MTENQKSSSIDPENEPLPSFDETNGLAEGLDGDDGGAITDDGNDGDHPVGSLFRDIVNPDDGDGLDGGENLSGKTRYSEEGRS